LGTFWVVTILFNYNLLFIIIARIEILALRVAQNIVFLKKE